METADFYITLGILASTEFEPPTKDHNLKILSVQDLSLECKATNSLSKGSKRVFKRMREIYNN
jgi:hypothetical protein